jgi:hypothetical protein
MPIAGEPNRGGTEADGTVSPDYCGFCYQKGEFTTPGVTLAQFVERLKKVMADSAVPDEAAQKALAILPTLKRWRNQ